MRVPRRAPKIPSGESALHRERGYALLHQSNEQLVVHRPNDVVGHLAGLKTSGRVGEPTGGKRRRRGRHHGWGAGAWRGCKWRRKCAIEAVTG